MATEGEQMWMSVRLAVGAAMIIGSMVFYFSFWFAMWRKEGKNAYIHMN